MRFLNRLLTGGLGEPAVCLVLVRLSLCVLGLMSVIAQVHAAEPDWEKLGPSILKSSEPVRLERNPLQQARQGTQAKPAGGRIRKEFIVKLRRHLEQQVRGVVCVKGRSLLLLGGRVCQVGQELPVLEGAQGGSKSVDVRIKSLEGGRLVLLLSEPEAEELGCEEWVYPLPEFMYQS